jgi:hypothetical protein
MELKRALGALENASPEQIPTVTREGDAVFDRVSTVVEEIDRIIGQVSAVRQKALGTIERIGSALRLAEERWEGLKTRGATEPSIRRALAGLQATAVRFEKVVQDHTLKSYEKVVEDVVSFDAEFEALSGQLDALDESMGLSRDGVQGDARALGLVQAKCDELVRQDPLLDPDQSVALLGKAGETYIEAERQLGLGTSEGYQVSRSLSERAKQYLSQAMELAEPLPESVREVRETLESLDAELLGDLRSRIDRVREQLRLYSRHWEAGQAENVAEAASKLDQVEIDLERISPNIRYRRRFRQSEVPEALEILCHGRESIEKAGELTLALEQEHDRIEAMRADLEQALMEVTERELPAMLKMSQLMLPELQQHLQGWEAKIVDLRDVASKVDQVDYDQAMDEWLPAILSQAEEIREMHERDVQHYRRTAKEVVRQLERQWARLIRLDPYRQPAPEEDAEALSSDLEAWHAEVERQAENPLALRELVGRRAGAFARRIDAAQHQIDQGRSRVSALLKQFQRCARGVRELRGSIRSMETQSDWPQLIWEDEEGEAAWGEAVQMERESQIAPTLREAISRLERAIVAAQNAEQIHVRTERQMKSALRRLDDEYGAVSAGLERRQQEVKRLREEGAPDVFIALEEHCASVSRIIEMAQVSTTFEDALRYLRDARDALARF